MSRDKEGHFVWSKCLILQKHIIITKMCESSNSTPKEYEKNWQNSIAKYAIL